MLTDARNPTSPAPQRRPRGGRPEAARSFRGAQLIAQDHDRRTEPFPIALKPRRHRAGAVDVRAEDNVHVAIAIQIANVHDQPAAGNALRESGGGEVTLTLVLEVNEAVPW